MEQHKNQNFPKPNLQIYIPSMYGEEFSFQQLFEDDNVSLSLGSNQKNQHFADFDKSLEEKKEVNIESRNYQSMKDMYISDTDSDNEQIQVSKKIRIEKQDNGKKCSGCYPIFQMNQEGHMGINGCLSDR
jgi:hypothetical protein